MPLQAFIDESGGKGQGRTFMMAGWIAAAEKWAQFSDEWGACLRSSPQIRYFKMREAAALSGEFWGLSEPSRDSKLRQLARIVARHALTAISCAMDIDALPDTFARFGAPYSDPYFWPFQITIKAICEDLAERGIQEPVEIIFDEQCISGPKAKLWYPLIRAAALHDDPDDPAAAIMPVEPLFRSDQDAPPLQAADMLAWLLRRSSANNWPAIEHVERTGREPATHPPEPGDFAWLASEDLLAAVEFSSHVQFLTRERMERIAADADRRYRDDPTGAAIPGGLRRLFLEIYRKRR
ncbi:MAG TPA: DUF3800 domain-containing protein [Thermoanaerobaculia bacterium]|jgi:hypothetical protein|nr:DUF3800 domain-containing protein [Thermoanaerobaculia bacterium]